MAGTERKRGTGSDLRRSLLLTAAGFALLIVTSVVIGLVRGDSDQSDSTAAKILFSALGLASVALMVWGGAVASGSLRATPLASTRGRKVVRAAIVLAALLPLLVIALWLVTVLGDGEGPTVPLIGAWLVAVVVTCVAGATAPEPGRRGLLVLPPLVAVAAVVLALSELLGIS